MFSVITRWWICCLSSIFWHWCRIFGNYNSSNSPMGWTFGRIYISLLASIRQIRSGFCVLNFLSILSNYVSPEKLKQITADQFCKTSIFEWNFFSKLPCAKCFLYNCRFYHSRIESLQKCSAFVCVSFSVEREFTLEDWKEI